MNRFIKFVILIVAIGSILTFTGCNGSYRYPSSSLSYPPYYPYQSYYQSLDRIDASFHHNIDEIYSIPLYGHCGY